MIEKYKDAEYVCYGCGEINGIVVYKEGKHYCDICLNKLIRDSQVKVYIYLDNFRKWYKTYLPQAEQCIRNGEAREYCHFKTDDLVYTDLTKL